MTWPFVLRSTFDLELARALARADADAQSTIAALRVQLATATERLKAANDVTVRAEAMMDRALRLIDRAAGAILPPDLPPGAGGPAKSVQENDRAAALRQREERIKAAQRGLE